MGSRTANSLRTLLAALLAVPAVFAATSAVASLGTVFETLGSVLGGPQGVASLYHSYSYVIDFIALLVILGSAFTYGLEKGMKNSGKAGKTIAWVLAIMAAIGVEMGIQTANQTLVGIVGPIGLLVLTFMLAFLLYGMLSKAIPNSRTMAFILAFDIAWLVTYVLWNAMGISNSFSTIFAVLNFLFSVSIIVVPIWAVIRWARGRGKSTSGEGEGGHRARHLDDNYKKESADLANIKREQQQLATEAPAQQQAEVTEIGSLEADTDAELKASDARVQATEEVEPELKAADQFLEQANEGIKATETQPPETQQQFKEQVRASKDRFGQYVTAIKSRMDAIEQEVNGPDAITRDEQIEKQLFERIKKTDLAEFDNENKIEKDIEQSEKDIRSAYMKTYEEQAHLQNDGIKNLGQVQGIVTSFDNSKEAFEKHLGNIEQFKEEYKILAQNVQELLDVQKTIEDSIEKRKNIRADERKTIADAPKRLVEFVQKSLSSIDLLDDKSLEDARGEAKQIGKDLKAIKSSEQQIKTLDATAEQAEERLKKDLEAHKELESDFINRLEQALNEEKSLTTLAETTGIALDAVRRSSNLHPSSSESIQKAGLRSLFTANLQKNLTAANNFIEKGFGDAQKELNELASKNEGNQIVAQAIAGVNSLKEQISAEWKSHIETQTAANKATLDKVAKSGITKIYGGQK